MIGSGSNYRSRLVGSGDKAFVRGEGPVILLQPCLTSGSTHCPRLAGSLLRLRGLWTTAAHRAATARRAGAAHAAGGGADRGEQAL